MGATGSNDPTESAVAERDLPNARSASRSTFNLTGRYDLDLYKPWRDQLAAQGHDARSLVDDASDAPVPPELERTFKEYSPLGPLRFAREVHLVDEIPIGLTESWSPKGTARSPAALTSDQEVVAECFAEIGFATTVQAELLRSYLDIPLVVVHARSRLADSRQLVELSRTSWLGSRVRLSYGRQLVLSDIDSIRFALGGAEHVGDDRSSE